MCPTPLPYGANFSTFLAAEGAQGDLTRRGLGGGNSGGGESFLPSLAARTFDGPVRPLLKSVQSEVSLAAFLERPWPYPPSPLLRAQHDLANGSLDQDFALAVHVAPQPSFMASAALTAASAPPSDSLVEASRSSSTANDLTSPVAARNSFRTVDPVPTEPPGGVQLSAKAETADAASAAEAGATGAGAVAGAGAGAVSPALAAAAAGPSSAVREGEEDAAGYRYEPGPNSAALLAAGDLEGSAFRVVGGLGIGGYSTVVEVEHVESRARYAMKVVSTAPFFSFFFRHSHFYFVPLKKFFIGSTKCHHLIEFSHGWGWHY